MDFSALFKRAGMAAAENSPVILTAIGVTGALTTAFFAARGAFKAAEVISEKQEEVIAQNKEDEKHFELVGDKLTAEDLTLTTREKFDLTWKLYVPAAGSAALTVAAIICSNKISDNRTAAMATAYTVAQRGFQEYQKKVVDKVGKTKEQAVRDEIAQDRITNNPISRATVIFSTTGRGNTWCYDMYSDRYFKSDIESIRQAVNTINEQIIHEGSASLTDYWHLLRINKTSHSDDLGWNTDKMLAFDHSAVLDENSEPALAIAFKIPPFPRYNRNSY